MRGYYQITIHLVSYIVANTKGPKYFIPILFVYFGYTYLGMNSMAKASTAWLKKMDDVLTEYFDVVMRTFGLIVCCFHYFPSSLLLYLLQQKHAHHFCVD